MYVTQHSTITDRTVTDALWDLYNVAYERIAAADITRETLYRHEFDEVMADSTYRTTVVRNDAGVPIAMVVIATDISVTRYLSVPYFQRTYPDRLAAGKIHYIMWVVVHPDHQATRTIFEMARRSLESEAADGTLLVFDLPESNQPAEVGRGAEFFFRIAKTIAPAELESFGVSRYYAIDFAPTVESEESAEQSERIAT
jgi:hypothetical protein